MLCRCENHGWPNGNENIYVAKIEPAGPTNEAIICASCETPGDIYLNDQEYYEYEYEGKRLYTVKMTGILQIQLNDSPEEVKEHLTRDEDNPPNEIKEPVAGSAADTDF